AWIEILHNSSFPWIALKLSREWTPPMMMLDWASGRWVMGLFAESLLFVLGILLRCKHYKRRCKIRAPCCNEIFCCRHCHNESTVPESLAKDRHEICRFDVQTVSHLCDLRHRATGESCLVDKGHYHCEDCGICRLALHLSFDLACYCT
ncbi:hypothetical protein B296_00057661, partial [Ensete ventricosum]